MPYAALPAARRMHYEIDGTVGGYNNTGYGTGLSTIWSGAQLLALNEETPSVDSNVLPNNGDDYIFFLFPELKDISFFICRYVFESGSGSNSISEIQGSTNTTNGVDGTWTNITQGAGTNLSGSSADWWRATAPVALTANNTSLTGLRFHISRQFNYHIGSVYLWGTKHAGQTPDDIIFLESDGTTEWPNDDDWGDVAAGSGATVHTYYVKNTSSLTAHSITVKSSGSDSGFWTVSLDNVSFGSSKSIASLTPGTTQVVYFKFTPPAAAGGNLRPYAGYIEADVASWS